MPQRFGDVWVCISQSSSGTIVFGQESIVIEYRPVWSEGVWIPVGSLASQKEPTNLWFRGENSVIGKTGFWFYEDSV